MEANGHDDAEEGRPDEAAGGRDEVSGERFLLVFLFGIRIFKWLI